MEENQLLVSTEMKSDLLSISRWTKFLAILGFIGIGFMLIAAFIMIVSSVIMSSYIYKDTLLMVIIAIFYLIFAVVYFFPVLYLMRSAIDLGKGVNDHNNELLASAIKNLKAHFKYMGIMIIATIGLYIIIVIGVVLYASMGMLNYL